MLVYLSHFSVREMANKDGHDRCAGDVVWIGGMLPGQMQMQSKLKLKTLKIANFIFKHLESIETTTLISKFKKFSDPTVSGRELLTARVT